MRTQSLARLASAALAALLVSFEAEAAPLTQEDVSLSLYASPDGAAWTLVDSSNLVGFFGVHRCLCPDSLAPVVELTASGQAHLGNSILGMTFLLGQSCQTSPSTCMALGSMSFSLAQSATPPSFSSALVFQAVQRTTAVSCTSLAAGATTLWAMLSQDGQALAFAPTMSLPVVTTAIGPPTAVTAEPANQGLLVHWSPPTNIVGVAGYQVLCLPRPEVASTAGYETCGLAASGALLDPADTTQVCSEAVATSTTSVRVSGLVNGVPYTVAVVTIDVSGGISALSPLVTATPQPTQGFWEKYQQAGGEASGCQVAPGSRRSGGLGLLLVVVVLLAWLARRGGWRRGAGLAVVLLLAAPAIAVGQDDVVKSSDEWAWSDSAPRPSVPPLWSLELGLGWYRPAIDQGLGNGQRPFAETFSGSRHPLWEVEVDYYLGHRFGTWGVGLRTGYYKVTAAAFLPDGITRSGDETALRLVPVLPSLLYRASGVPGLKAVPLIPYVKLGLGATYWTATTTGSKAHSGLSWGWHGAAGIMLGLGRIANRAVNPEGLADPCALFFEWDYVATNGLGLTDSLHVGDNTWFAGLVFDL